MGAKNSFHHSVVPLPQEGGLLVPPSADDYTFKFLDLLRILRFLPRRSREYLSLHPRGRGTTEWWKEFFAPTANKLLFQIPIYRYITLCGGRCLTASSIDFANGECLSHWVLPVRMPFLPNRFYRGIEEGGSGSLLRYLRSSGSFQEVCRWGFGDPVRKHSRPPASWAEACIPAPL